MMGLLYVVAVLVTCGALDYDMIHRDDEERKKAESEKRRYHLSVPFVYLPPILAVLFVISCVKTGLGRAIEQLIAFGFGLAVIVSLYYLILNAFLKGLRQYFSARACAMLWFVPTFLVLCFGGWPLVEPNWVIHLNKTVLWIILSVWLLGFVGVWIWKLREDFCFRREIMAGATVVTDQEIWETLYEEMEKAGIKPDNTAPKRKKDNEKVTLYTIGKKLWGWMQPPEMPPDAEWVYQPNDFLIRSPHVKTPMTIGRSTILSSMYSLRIVLPEKDYSREEMMLVLRHELIHILRGDSKKKRLLVFCKALCWFNPLVWTAMRRSAEDMELSCDEAVVMEENEQTRKKYAELILQTAGDERGFTTCLSASAESLRYRLKSIVRPGKRKAGIWILFPMLVLLYMSFGRVTLGFDASTGAQLVFHGVDTARYEIASVHLSAEEEAYYRCADPEAFTEYLAGLPMSRLAGNYRSPSEPELVVAYNGPEGSFGITVRGRILEITPMREETREDDEYNLKYYLDEDVDWDYIRSLLV